MVSWLRFKIHEIKIPPKYFFSSTAKLKSGKSKFLDLTKNQNAAKKKI